MLSTILIAAIAFVSTNIDDIFLLVGFFSDRSYKPSHIVLGQYLGIGILVLVSALCAFVSLSVAPAYVGLLGVLPILIGVKKLWEVFRNDSGEEKKVVARGGIFSVSSVTIANG